MAIDRTQSRPSPTMDCNNWIPVFRKRNCSVQLDSRQFANHPCNRIQKQRDRVLLRIRQSPRPTRIQQHTHGFTNARGRRQTSDRRLARQPHRMLETFTGPSCLAPIKNQWPTSPSKKERPSLPTSTRCLPTSNYCGQAMSVTAIGRWAKAASTSPTGCVTQWMAFPCRRFFSDPFSGS